MTDTPKKPRARRTPSAKPKVTKPKKATAPSRSKKSSPSPTKVDQADGATQVAILVQEVKELKQQVEALRSNVVTDVFQVLYKMSSAYLESFASGVTFVVKEIGVDGEEENAQTQTIFVGANNEFVMGIYQDDKVKIVLDSSSPAVNQIKLLGVIRDFLISVNAEYGSEIKINLYETH